MTDIWDPKLGIDSKFGGPGVFEFEPINKHFNKKFKFDDNADYFATPAVPPISFTDAIKLGSDMNPYGNSIFDTKTQGSGKTLAYPMDIDEEQDHIEIDEYAYARPKSRGDAQNAAGPGATTKSGKKIGGTILLPMPKATDASGAEWGKGDLTGDEMNRSTRASGWKGLYRRQKGRGQENAEAYGNEFTEGEGASPQASTGDQSRNQRNYWWLNGREGALRAKTAAKNIGGNVSASSLLFRNRGQILNPNAELLFQGPALRSFDFNWLMVARSKKEGETIREIIRKLKLGASPKWNNTMLLEVPSIWQISYRSGGEELRTVNKFKECALVSLTADYAPDGIWSAYQDSQPIALRMGLSFKELRAVYNTDQQETHQQSVGF